MHFASRRAVVKRSHRPGSRPLPLRCSAMPTSGGGSPYASRLAALASPDVAQQVTRASATLVAPEVPPESEWVREYGRFRPASDPWAVLVMVCAALPVRLTLGFVSEGPADLVHPETGPLVVHRFPDDTGLPALPSVLAALTDLHVVRYRPGRRCTARGTTDEGDRFVKVLRDPAPELQHDAEALWESGQRGELGFRVAEPVGWDASAGALWQGVVPGVDASASVFGPDGAELCVRIGAALGELARSTVVPAQLAPSSDQRARTDRALRRVVERVPGLAARAAAVGAVIEQRHEQLRPRELVPAHGSAHTHQWLVADDGALGLIDFDRFALGEPELDIATFAAELDTERTLALPVEVLERALCDGYESVAGRLDPDRIALYRTEKRIAKVARTAWAIRADFAERAERHLRTVEADLAS